MSLGVCACVRVSKWKESARRMASTISENRKRNEKKSIEQEEAHFVSRVTVILTREKERDYLLNLHMSQSTCFGTWTETGVDFYGWQWVPRAGTVQKGEHVKNTQAKRWNNLHRRRPFAVWHTSGVIVHLAPGTSRRALGYVLSNFWHTHTLGTRTAETKRKKKNQSLKKEGRKNNNKREEVRPNSPN